MRKLLNYLLRGYIVGVQLVLLKAGVEFQRHIRWRPGPEKRARLLGKAERRSGRVEALRLMGIDAGIRPEAVDQHLRWMDVAIDDVRRTIREWNRK